VLETRTRGTSGKKKGNGQDVEDETRGLRVCAGL
jgi:hypothetical protein